MRRLVILVAIGLVAVAAPAAARPRAARPVTITLVTHDFYNVSKSVIRAFTRETGVKVKVFRAGDAGAALNQVILTKEHPRGDVLYGVDNTYLSRALDAGIFDPYQSPRLDQVPATYVLDPRHRVTPVDRADVCVNDDKQWLAEHHLPRPKTLEDLAKPEYRGLLVVENPAIASPGLAFLLATVAHFGEDGWRGYWTSLRANDVKIVDDWGQAWNENFSAVSENGERPLVVSYASSPPATVTKKTGKARAGTVLASCFRQIEFVGVLKGTTHRSAAREFVDFMLSKPFQEDMPNQMYVFPVREDARLPADFAKFAKIANKPLSLSPDDVAKHRDEWIRQWTDTVLR
jgi:thiamine transport system substrate-binding protein